MRVLRFPLPITDHQVITLPGPVLSVAQSRVDPDNVIDLWAFDRGMKQPVDAWTADVWMVGTGNPMPIGLVVCDDPFSAGRSVADTFVGTVVTPVGGVWHVFTTKHQPRQDHP